MRKMIIILLGLAVVVAFGVAGAIACGGWMPFAARYVDDATIATAVREIHVSGGIVAVQVRPGSASSVEIHRTVSYLNPLHGRPGCTYRIDGTTLDLGDDASTALVKVEYVVVAPAGVRVTADIATGSLDLTGVSTVDAKVSTGSIQITDATGDVMAEADTGSVTGRDLHSSSIVAITKTGQVSLDLAIPANVEARTSMGAVNLTVPAGAYRIDATQRGGQPKLALANDPNSAYHLALRTDMGQISLTAR